jgi:hypothetical protein
VKLIVPVTVTPRASGWALKEPFRPRVTCDGEVVSYTPRGQLPMTSTLAFDGFGLEYEFPDPGPGHEVRAIGKMVMRDRGSQKLDVTTDS